MCDEASRVMKAFRWEREIRTNCETLGDCLRNNILRELAIHCERLRCLDCQLDDSDYQNVVTIISRNSALEKVGINPIKVMYYFISRIVRSVFIV